MAWSYDGAKKKVDEYYKSRRTTKFYKPKGSADDDWGTNIIFLIPIPGMEEEPAVIVTHHYIRGGEGKTVLNCNRVTHGLPCFICDYRREFKDKISEKKYEAWSPRMTYQVWAVDCKEPDKGVQIASLSKKNFDHIMELAKKKNVSFGDLVKSRAVVFKFRPANKELERHIPEYSQEWKLLMNRKNKEGEDVPVKEGILSAARRDEDWLKKILDSAPPVAEINGIESAGEAAKAIGIDVENPFFEAFRKKFASALKAYRKEHGIKEEEDPAPAAATESVDDEDEPKPKGKKKPVDDDDDEPVKPKGGKKPVEDDEGSDDDDDEVGDDDDEGVEDDEPAATSKKDEEEEVDDEPETQKLETGSVISGADLEETIKKAAAEEKARAAAAKAKKEKAAAAKNKE